jgi:hypothetical protein
MKRMVGVAVQERPTFYQSKASFHRKGAPNLTAKTQRRKEYAKENKAICGENAR